MTAKLLLRLLPLLPFIAFLGACQDDAPTLTGYVEADRIHIGLPLGGLVTDVMVRRGDVIPAGTPVFQLDDRVEQARKDAAAARLEQARAQRDDLLTGLRPKELEALKAQRDQAAADARQANAELTRQRGLSRTDATARSLLEKAEADAARTLARVAEIEARLAQAQEGARSAAVAAAEAAITGAEADLSAAVTALSLRTAYAPMAGRVEETLFRPGETVAAASPVVILLPPEQILIRFYLGPDQIGQIRPGQALPISCPGCAEGLTAQIRFVAGEASYAPPVLYSRDNAASLVFRVDAVPDRAAETLRPGQPVRITLPTPRGQ